MKLFDVNKETGPVTESSSRYAIRRWIFLPLCCCDFKYLDAEDEQRYESLRHLLTSAILTSLKCPADEASETFLQCFDLELALLTLCVLWLQGLKKFFKSISLRSFSNHSTTNWKKLIFSYLCFLLVLFYHSHPCFIHR